MVDGEANKVLFPSKGLKRSYEALGYGVINIDWQSFRDASAKAEREKSWFEKNFPTIIVSEKIAPDTIYAVNWGGIVDDMQRGKSFKDAVLKNSARITGLF